MASISAPRVVTAVGDTRFYENEYPEVDEVVLVQVTRIEAHGAYAILLEYNNIEGLILISELSKRRIRSISKLVRVGKIDYCSVLRVEKKKGNVDLSKRRVSPSEAVECEAYFSKAKVVHAMMRNIAIQLHLSIEDVCRQISWRLYEGLDQAYDPLRRLAAGNGEDVLKILNEGQQGSLPANVLQALQDEVLRRLQPQPLKIRADVDVSCFNRLGVEAVKSAILAGKNSVGSVDLPVSVRLVAPPQYMLVTSTFSKDDGINRLEEVIEIIQKHIEESGGKFVLKHKPQIVGEDESVPQEEVNTEDEDDSEDEAEEEDE